MIDVDNPVVEFNALDRCDGCGAQAVWLAVRDDLSELKFCNHHYAASEQNLLDEGWKLIGDGEQMERLAKVNA